MFGDHIAHMSDQNLLFSNGVWRKLDGPGTTPKCGMDDIGSFIIVVEDGRLISSLRGSEDVVVIVYIVV